MKIIFSEKLKSIKEIFDGNFKRRALQEESLKDLNKIKERIIDLRYISYVDGCSDIYPSLREW